MSKIMPVQKVGAVSQCIASPQSYASRVPGASYRTPTKKSIAAFALSQLEAARKLDIENHENNATAIEANMAVRDRVIALMTEVGMPKTRKEKAGTRYGMPKYRTVGAGWLDDLRDNVPTTDGFDHATATYNRLRAEYEKYAADGEREAEQAATAAAQEDERRKAERRANLELAEIILRYDLDRDSEWSDVLDALRKRDQRLDLAVAMQQTRSDWSEGFYRVSDALGRFKIDSEEDKEIANDVVSYLNDDHDDGRVFRDCQWNYGKLFSTASDQQLSTDVQTAVARADA